MLRTLIVAVATWATIASSASAVPIEVFSTGVDVNGAVVANGTVGDAHYTLVSAPAGISTTNVRAADSNNGFPIGPWLGDNTISRWIGPNTDSEFNGPVGNYVYETTFDLDGLNAATAILTGSFATDNTPGTIELNGTDVGVASNGFTAFTNFTITSGFVPGINTLSFLVRNAGGPTGLRVEISGEAEAVIPLPAPALLLLTALGALTLRARRAQV
ncbi:MAG: hypothetical protein AAFV86_07855 [Pseudomonadota bacterium]